MRKLLRNMELAHNAMYLKFVPYILQLNSLKNVIFVCFSKPYHFEKEEDQERSHFLFCTVLYSLLAWSWDMVLSV